MAYHSENYRIIHLSDLHFGSKHAYTNEDGILLEGDRQRIISYPISNIIIDFIQLNNKPRKETVILIAGDLADFNQKNDFKDANRFLNRLIEKTRIPKERIVLVPGNHDVAWSNYLKNDSNSMFNLFKRHFKNFLNPFRSNGPCYYFSKLNLLVYCINTCVLCGAKEYIPGLQNLLSKIGSNTKKKKDILSKLIRIEQGFVGSTQLSVMNSNVESTLNDIPPAVRENTLRVALLHHHVNPLHPEIRRFSGCIDAASVKNNLMNLGFHLILHGHRHLPHYCMDSTVFDRSDKSIGVIASGSMGGSIDIGWNYSFNVIDVQNNKSNIAKLSVIRKEFNGGGIDISQCKPWGLQPSKHRINSMDIAVESLANALSGEIPNAFNKSMASAHYDYCAINPVSVELYEITNNLIINSRVHLNKHESIHKLFFVNKDTSNLHRLILPIAGTKLINDNSELKIKAHCRYHFRNKWKDIKPKIIKDYGYIKILQFDFTEPGIEMDKKVYFELRYNWIGAVDIPESEWGLENWVFKYGITKAVVKCRVDPPWFISSAEKNEIIYDNTSSKYNRVMHGNLNIKHSRRLAEMKHDFKRNTCRLIAMKCIIERDK